MQKVGPDLPRLPSILRRAHNKTARVFVPRNVHFWTFMRNNAAGTAFTHVSLGQSVLELPVLLVVEDDEHIQSLVEDALIEAGFEPAIAASGEEAVTLLKSSFFIKERPVTYRALATDINLKGMMNGWEVAKQAREIAGVSGRLHNWRGCRPVGIARRAEQHLTKKTFCTSAARDSGLPTAKHGYAR